MATFNLTDENTDADLLEKISPPTRKEKKKPRRAKGTQICYENDIRIKLLVGKISQAVNRTVGERVDGSIGRGFAALKPHKKNQRNFRKRGGHKTDRDQGKRVPKEPRSRNPKINISKHLGKKTAMGEEGGRFSLETM